MLCWPVEAYLLAIPGSTTKRDEAFTSCWLIEECARLLPRPITRSRLWPTINFPNPLIAKYQTKHSFVQLNASSPSIIKTQEELLRELQREYNDGSEIRRKKRDGLAVTF